MSEIRFNLTLKKKIEFSVSFMLLFCIKIHCSEVWFTPNYGVCGDGGGGGGGGEAKVLCLLRHRGVQLILAYS